MVAVASNIAGKLLLAAELLAELGPKPLWAPAAGRMGVGELEAEWAALWRLRGAVDAAFAASGSGEKAWGRGAKGGLPTAGELAGGGG